MTFPLLKAKLKQEVRILLGARQHTDPEPLQISHSVAEKSHDFSTS